MHTTGSADAATGASTTEVVEPTRSATSASLLAATGDDPASETEAHNAAPGAVMAQRGVLGNHADAGVPSSEGRCTEMPAAAACLPAVPHVVVLPMSGDSLPFSTVSDHGLTYSRPAGLHADMPDTIRLMLDDPLARLDWIQGADGAAGARSMGSMDGLPAGDCTVGALAMCDVLLDMGAAGARAGTMDLPKIDEDGGSASCPAATSDIPGASTRGVLCADLIWNSLLLAATGAAGFENSDSWVRSLLFVWAEHPAVLFQQRCRVVPTTGCVGHSSCLIQTS